MVNEIVAGLIGGLVGSLTGGLIQFYLQKADKKVNFSFETKKKLYLKIDAYLTEQNRIMTRPFTKIIRGHLPEQDELRTITKNLISNVNKIRGLFYGSITGGVINKKISDESMAYEAELQTFMRKDNIDYEKIFLRTNYHVNIIHEVMKKELGLK